MTLIGANRYSIVFLEGAERTRPMRRRMEFGNIEWVGGKERVGCGDRKTKGLGGLIVRTHLPHPPTHPSFYGKRSADEKIDQVQTDRQTDRQTD